jgi:mono/diheme cytochrome c family protein
MKYRGLLNLLLFLGLLAMGTLGWTATERDVRHTNYELLPETQMAYSVAYESFAPNPNFSDGMTLRVPPIGTIARGQMPWHYQPTPEDALRAGQELQNPFSEKDAARQERGSFVFANFCQVCHGPIGQGDGPITQAGFPPPAPLLAERAVQMRDGQMFHVLTFGQQNMPPFAAQLSRQDRWSVILYVRKLQGTYAPRPTPSRSEEVARLFWENCVACHGEDGTGKRVRKVWPGIPDFTDLAWQMSQTEMAVLNQIQYGSHPLMPAFRHKLTSEEILRLAVYVRSFAAHSALAQVSPSSTNKAANVFGTYCFVCHDPTGTGNPLIRRAMPELPDFTAAAWQKSRADTDLAQSILLGKGKFMPPMSDKLGTVDVKQIVSLVRAFQGGKQVIPSEAPRLQITRSIATTHLETLRPPGPPQQAIVQTPRTALPVLGASSVGLGSSSPDQFSSLAVLALISQKNSATVASGPPPPQDEHSLPVPPEDMTGIRMGASIFRQFCFVCHGLDGKGTSMRPVLPPIPDFTNPAFHKEHSDAQLVISILDGKGTLMPANRGRVTEDQAHGLVAYIRTFSPATLHATKPSASNTGFERSFQQLQQEWNELQKELEKMRAQKQGKGSEGYP